MGSDFEPAVDAMVEAEISGPGGFFKKCSSIRGGLVAGQYAGDFRPQESGAYEVSYKLEFPDGETLEQSGYIRVGDSGIETKDTSFAERDLKMLANLTGGKYQHISDFDSGGSQHLLRICPPEKEKKPG